VIITILSGGVGGARFARGVREHLRRTYPAGDVDLRIIVNTGDDMWLAGLRITPDLDSVMYTLAGANDEVRGWGRIGESERVSDELKAYGVGWPWFTLGDLDLGTHIARTSFLRDGLTLSEATARIQSRWDVGATLIPVTDSEVETHVVVEGGSMHFQEWWTRHRATLPALDFEQRGFENAVATNAAFDAIADADVILVAPSNPVVSIGTILGIPGIQTALGAAAAPVVGVSPIINGAVVRGMADACLTAIGVETTAHAVASHYGARGNGGLLDAWLVDSSDSAEVEGIAVHRVPLWMRDLDTSAQLAADALHAAGF